jgi:hypothetical protein
MSQRQLNFDNERLGNDIPDQSGEEQTITLVLDTEEIPEDECCLTDRFTTTATQDLR